MVNDNKQDSSSPNRRELLQGALAGAAGIFTLGGIGVVSADEEKTRPGGEQSIDISNSVHNITFGETNSDSWAFNGTDHLYSENYAFREGSGSLVGSYDGTITDAYPDTGVPGETYSATIEVSVGGTTLAVDRLVELDSTDALVTTTYNIRNVGSSSLNELQFYQYIDYDIFGLGGGTGQYVSNPFEYLYQYDGGVYTACRGATMSSAHDVVEYDGGLDAHIPLSDQDSYSGDVAFGLKWRFGSLSPGDSVSQTVAFAMGDTQQAVENLLSSIEELEALFGETITALGQEIGPPLDCDGDELYEDVNGDEQVDARDQRALQTILSSHTRAKRLGLDPGESNGRVQRLTAAEIQALDFNDDGVFDRRDVAALGRQISRGTACDGGDNGDDGDNGMPTPIPD